MQRWESSLKNISRAGKPLSLLLILVLIITALLGCESDRVESPEPPPEPKVTADPPTEPPKADEPQRFDGYDPFLDEYRIFADSLINGDEEIFFNPSLFGLSINDIRYRWDSMMVEITLWSYRDLPKARETFGYALEDLNGNGSPELILLFNDYTVLAVFSMSNGSPQLLDAFWPRHRGAINDSGLICVSSSNGADDWYHSVYQIEQDDSELLLIFEYGHASDEGYYLVSNGEKRAISESDYERLQEEYPIQTETVAKEITKNSGLDYIPLFD